jgi:hypothetical protein
MDSIRYCYYNNMIVKDGTETYLVNFRPDYMWGGYSSYTDSTKFRMSIVKKVKLEGNKIIQESIDLSKDVTWKQIKSMKFFDICGKMLDGKTLKIRN